MSEFVEYLGMFTRFPRTLRKFLQHRLTPERAQEIVRERMAHRADYFLHVVQTRIYGHTASPYLKLLQHAGCEFGDLDALVRAKGLENALWELRSAGVYVSYEEFKGRTPIERNGLTFTVTPRDFDNPLARRDFKMETGGSTGLATMVNQDLDNLTQAAPNLMLTYAAHGVLDAPQAMWAHFLPGPGFRNIFIAAYMGKTVDRWFAPNGWRDSRYWMRYALATFYMIGWARLSGLKVPLPEIRRLDDAGTIARYVAKMAQQHGQLLFMGGPSRALRICIAAEQLGLDLHGVVFRMGGEPATSLKVQVIERVGGRILPGYVATETGSIALGCAQPAQTDDMHLLQDTFALIAHPQRIGALDMTVPAFHLTSLLESSPQVLLNAQLGDYGVVEERACGCQLETYGYTTHIHSIRSYSKLVGESATLMGKDMLRILENLPARFGGTPLDYQLVERENPQGLTRLCLVIHPRVEIADEGAVIPFVLDALRASSPMGDAARTVWQQAQTLELVRAEPTLTARGKLLPLAIEREQRGA